MAKYIPLFDQGATSSRGIVFDHNGKVCSSAGQEFQQYYPQPGCVEQFQADILGLPIERPPPQNRLL
jgi:glycerol kinase